MAKYRRNRINDAVQKELSVALGGLRDPRLTDCFVSITRAEVAPDLRVARVYFSVMGDEAAAKDARAALEKAEGKLRHHLAATLNLRLTPELLFYRDDSIAHGAHIAELLREIHAKDEADAAKRGQECAGAEDAGMTGEKESAEGTEEESHA